FSSRRRHTRFSRDWSSDVCSSDLDELLKEAARRIGRCVRDPDMVARLGGDEFAIVLDFIHSADEAVAVAERVIESLAEPMRIAGDRKSVVSGKSVAVGVRAGRRES